MSSDRPPWDLIVVGGGAAGLTSAIMAGEIGARVLLVDRERLGGDCTWSGCVPSKALLESAHVAHTVATANKFGIQAPPPTVDFAAVMARLRAVQKTIADGESSVALADHNVDVAFGGATFIDAHTIQIGDATDSRVERADHFLIATGSRPAEPAVDGLAAIGALTNETLFQLTAQPQTLAIIGGGPIGCEMAQAFARLGTEVTLLQRGPQLLPRDDAEAAALLEDVLRREGVDVRLKTAVLAASRREGRTCLTLDDSTEVSAHAVLVAAGRQARTDGLNLSAAGIETEQRGAVRVDDKLRTTAKHIYAAGDCTGGPMFTHWAEAQARVATRNILFRGSEKQNAAALPWVTFTDPEIARVGMTLDDAKEHHPSARALVVPHTQVDRAQCAGRTEGFSKVIVDDNERILGAHIAGAHAGELLTEWVLAISCDLTLDQIGQTIHPYPTFSRAGRRVADASFFEKGIAGWKTSIFGTFRGRQS